MQDGLGVGLLGCRVHHLSRGHGKRPQRVKSSPPKLWGKICRLHTISQSYYTIIAPMSDVGLAVGQLILEDWQLANLSGLRDTPRPMLVFTYFGILPVVPFRKFSSPSVSFALSWPSPSCRGFGKYGGQGDCQQHYDRSARTKCSCLGLTCIVVESTFKRIES